MPENDESIQTGMVTDKAPEQGETPDMAAELEKWKALSRKNEENAKANKAAADRAAALEAKLKEIEDANLSEVERAKKEAADAKAQLEAAIAAQRSAEIAALKTRIGAEKGLPAALVARLAGEDEAAIAADAEAILAALPKSEPVLDIGQGKKSDNEPDPIKSAIDRGFSI